MLSTALTSTVSGRVVIAWLALYALVILAWWNSISGGPIFDDHFLVVADGCFGSWAGIKRTLSLLSSDVCAYRPMRYLSYGVDRAVLGSGFWSHHVGNIANHLLSTTSAGLLGAVLFSTRDGDDGHPLLPSGALWFGLVVAALWAMHPVQTDSVSYVSGRRDILAGGWTMFAVAGAIIARRRGGIWWLWPLWATLFGFLSKESAVVIPVVAALWLVRGTRWSDWAGRNAGVLLAVGLGLGLSFVFVLQRGVLDSYSQRGLFEWWGGSIVTNFATVAALQLLYLRQVFGLAPLIGDYHAETIPLATQFGDPRAAGGVALVLGLLALAVVLWRRRPLMAYGILYYLVGLGPVSHVIPHHELYAEHYLYIPLFGAVLATVDGARWLMELAPDAARARTYARVVLAVVLSMMALVIVSRNDVWQNERVFYEEVRRLAPTNQRAAGNLIHIYGDAGDWERMSAQCRWMAPQWIPGGAPGRQALMRCADVAASVNDRAGVEEFAGWLVRNHPDVGRGWRLLAQAATQAGECERGLESTNGWWETTRDPRAAELLTELWVRCDRPTSWVAGLRAMIEEAVGLGDDRRARLRSFLPYRGSPGACCSLLSGQGAAPTGSLAVPARVQDTRPAD
jgi:hypothetical protein